MVHLRQAIRRGRLLAWWEPGLFTLPGVLLLWAGFVVLHRTSLYVFQGDGFLLGVCVALLFAGGVVLAGGRAGVVFDPARSRWGYWAGILRPLCVLWRPLEEPVAVLVEAERYAPGVEVYSVSMVRGDGGAVVRLGSTESASVAASLGESLACFLNVPLQVRAWGKETKESGSSVWGSANAVLTRDIRPGKMRTEKGRVALPLSLRRLRGRGPALLGIFMAFVAVQTIRHEDLLSTAWGVAATVLAALLVVGCLTWGIAVFLRRETLYLRKDALVFGQSSPGRAQAETGEKDRFSWNEIAYLSVVPQKAGFLSLAGRDACLVVGDRRRSIAFGAGLTPDQLRALYAHILARLRRRK